MGDRAAEARARAGETKRRRSEEQLYDAAFALIREEGWSVRLSQVAERAGVSSFTLYNVFENKGDMFRKVGRSYVTAKLHTAFEDEPTTDANYELFLSELWRKVSFHQKLVGGAVIDYFERRCAEGDSAIIVPNHLDFVGEVSRLLINRRLNAAHVLKAGVLIDVVVQDLSDPVVGMLSAMMRWDNSRGNRRVQGFIDILEIAFRGWFWAIPDLADVPEAQ